MIEVMPAKSRNVSKKEPMSKTLLCNGFGLTYREDKISEKVNKHSLIEHKDKDFMLRTAEYSIVQSV